jgi:hypothetical protein
LLPIVAVILLVAIKCGLYDCRPRSFWWWTERSAVQVSCTSRLDLYCGRGIYHYVVGPCCRVIWVDTIVRESPYPVGMRWPRTRNGVGW